MLSVGTSTVRTCAGITRREVLQVGGLSALGLSLPTLYGSEARASQSPSVNRKSEISCIFLWLDGGPSQFETFDPKPGAKDDIRGPYGALSTSVPGLQISELMPQMAPLMDQCALIRSMTHSFDSHSPHIMMTGFRDKTTSHGAVVTNLKPSDGDMPPYVHLGSRLVVGGGNLGAGYDPVEVRDPTGNKLELPQFSLSANIKAERFAQRRELLAAIDRMRADAHTSAGARKLDGFYQRAINMLTSETVRQAFDLSREAPRLRDRYGANFFGQSCLMARRLVEAGTRFVQIKWYEGPAWDAWDTHGADLAGLVRLEQHLCPRLDQGLSALITDLRQRGLLDTTLVVACGEFGRTPKINKLGGRDHWPPCQSVFLAGGGVPGGTVVGQSDPDGAYPVDRAVSPLEFAATLYKLLGIDLNLDPRVRPYLGSAAAVPELA